MILFECICVYQYEGLMFVNCVSFKSRVIYEKSKANLSEVQREYIDKFEEGIVDDTKFLGEGVTSKAYYSQSQNFVIKQNKQNPFVPSKKRGAMGSLAHENNILLSIGDNVKTAQKGIGYVETEKGGQFLLSTLMRGAPANHWSNPFKEKHIDRLLRNLYRLDKSQIIHCDLSRPNLLLDANYDVNIIDFQWGEKFYSDSPYSNYFLKNSVFPPFEIPNNATMFETAALPGYLKSMSATEAEEFMTKYLKNKATYTEKKYNKMSCYYNEHPWAIDYFTDFELAKTKAYNSLDSNIKTAELLKMNMLNSHRRQYSCYDINKIEPRNVLRAIPLMVKAKQYADKLSNIQAKFESDQIYFKFMNDYGKFWQNKINSWYPKTIEWLFKVVTGVTQSSGRILFPEKFNDFSKLNVAEITNDVTIQRKTFWQHLFEYDEVAVAERHLRQLFRNSYNSISAYNQNISEVKRITNKLFKRTF